MGKKKEKGLSASLEDYLEAIYILGRRDGAVRVKDVGERLGVAPSSVTSALRSLGKRGMVEHDPYDLISLTDDGRKHACGVLWKHEVLTDFFVNVLAIEPKAGNECACEIEHVMPDSILERLIDYIEFEERSHGGGITWTEETGFVCNGQMSCEMSGAKEGGEDSDSKKEKAPMRIRDMEVGQTAKVTGYVGKDRTYRHKLLRMGLIKRVEFKLVRKAPMGDPVEIELQGFKLTLRKAESDAVEIELI